MKQSPNNQIANRILAGLKEDYTLVGTHHVKAWHVWLIMGIFAGAIGATAFIANRSGKVETGKTAGPVYTDAESLELPTIRHRTKICESGKCYWEMVIAGVPDNPNLLFHTNGQSLSRSSDGGRTWITEDMKKLFTLPHPFFLGHDAKIIGLKGGDFAMVMNVSKCFGPPSNCQGEPGGLLLKGAAAGSLTASWVKEPAVPLTQFFDYGKIAVDPSTRAIYIAARSGPHISYHALFVSRDGGKTFQEYPLDLSANSAESISVGPDGTVYVLYKDIGEANKVVLKIARFKPFNSSPPVFDLLSLPTTFFWAPVRFSTTGNERWVISGIAKLVADTHPTSRNRGRLWVTWQQPEGTVGHPGNEEYYGYNFDVFVSYSDDQGKSWSPAIKANDDIGSGDQVHPSIAVDQKGTLHLAFIDHRKKQNQPVFDVFYAKSSSGKIFSKNLRVTQDQIFNEPANTRALGDYMDMVAASSPKRVYVAYPCGHDEAQGGPDGACLAVIDP